MPAQRVTRRRVRPIARRALLLALLLLPAAGPLGCATSITWYESNAESRRASFRPHADAHVHEMPLEVYLDRHTVGLYSNADVTVRETDDGRTRMRLERIDSAKPITRGLAVPLTRDGYFLTASHAANGEPLRLVLPRAEDRVVEARIVWRDDRRRISKQGEVTFDADLALLHAPLEPRKWDRTVLWAPVADLKRGDPVVLGTRSWDPIGGQYLRSWRPDSTEQNVPFTWVQHTAPVASGDSGGPVFLADGRFLGVTTGAVESEVIKELMMVLRISRRMDGAVAIAPDPEALMRIIEKDRAERSGPKTAAEGGAASAQ